MKTVKILFLLLIATAIFSCKSTKQINQEQSKTITEQRYDVTSKIYTQQDEQSKTELTDKSINTSISNTYTTITEYSSPDAAGNQYPIRTTESCHTTWNSNEANITSKAEQTERIQQQQNIEEEHLLYSSQSKDQKSNSKTKISTWVYISVFFLGIGILIIFYLILKRFKIVK